MSDAKVRADRRCQNCKQIFITTAKELKQHAKYCRVEPELTSEPLLEAEEGKLPPPSQNAL